ncbi:MAG: 3D domain-containing protein [Lachnospiraceae bacterium]|nr:3D domain-containing protein [Lachnospiraceae bacterium]
MKKSLKILAMLFFVLLVGTKTADAYNKSQDPITVQVTDNGYTTVYETSCLYLEDLFDEAGIVINNDDFVSESLRYKLSNNDKITVERTIAVNVIIDGVPRYMTTKKATVGEFLDEISESLNVDYVLKGNDEDDFLVYNMDLTLASKYERVYTVAQEVPFETQVIENDTMAYGTQKIIQEGQAGQIETSIKATYVGDEIVDSDESSVVTKESVPAIIEQGIAHTALTDSGRITYTKAVNVTATGYTPYDAGCNGITATGTKAEYGVIAVDPNYIELGTKLFIPGYGYAVAEDTGGAIKGSRIDLCYNTTEEAFSWGVKNVTVYILG